MFKYFVICVADIVVNVAFLVLLIINSRERREDDE